MTREYLESMGDDELFELYKEANNFRETGVLSMDSKIRRVSMVLTGKQDALMLTLLCSDLYNVIADRYFLGDY